ncbi:MAG: PP2C family protein-serine/threonine phosphatase, partial [Rhodothermales bacterium]|nr:PP2C family protein-serine/threonine phosphatase [Rhodothermales bacterium]
METRMLDRFKDALTAHRARLAGWLRSEAEGAPVGCAATGHASGGALPVLAEIDRALGRIADRTFGRCTQCSGEVEPERLSLDFTTCVCLDHYSASEVRALERDLELAARVQRHLFPCCVPALPQVQIAAHAQPASILSGDYYDFFSAPDGAQGIALADVMGKGLPASMLMANLQASLRILGPEHDDLDALAARLNGLFRYNLKLIRFISLFLLTVDAEAGLLRYCNAGHHPPLLWDGATGAVTRLDPTGPALGIVPAPTFSARTLPFNPGDTLVLYTDGLVEARDPEGEEFGEARLSRYLERHHAAPAEVLLAGLREVVTGF